MKLRYLEEMLLDGKENIHEALIVKVTSSGVVIELPEIGLQGFIYACDLPGGYRSEEKALKDCHVGKVIFAKLMVPRLGYWGGTESIKKKMKLVKYGL